MEFIRNNYQSDNCIYRSRPSTRMNRFSHIKCTRTLIRVITNLPPTCLPTCLRLALVRASKTRSSPGYLRSWRKQYAALASMCDSYLGKVLDLMDELDKSWDDTLLIVCYGSRLSTREHDWWAKINNPVQRTGPHPVVHLGPSLQDPWERRKSLVQMIDIPATLLEFFALSAPPICWDTPLGNTVPMIRRCVSGICLAFTVDTSTAPTGAYVYMRAPASPQNAPAL